MIILAGGRGTRLSSLTNGKQKCAIEFGGKPFIHHLLTQLEALQADKISILAGHMSNDIHAAVDAYLPNNNIDVITEQQPLGTGGCLTQLATEFILNGALIINGDTYFQITKYEFNIALSNYRNRKKNIDGLVIAGVSASNTGAVSVVSTNKATQKFTQSKLETLDPALKNSCFSGWSIASKEFFLNLPQGVYSFEDAVLRHIKTTRNDFNVHITNSYFFDIGTPERFYLLQQEL